MSPPMECDRLRGRAITGSLQSLLFGVPLVDWLTYGAVAALVAMVVAAASYLPARRAASTDPLALLRRE